MSRVKRGRVISEQLPYELWLEITKFARYREMSALRYVVKGFSEYLKKIHTNHHICYKLLSFPNENLHYVSNLWVGKKTVKELTPGWFRSWFSRFRYQDILNTCNERFPNLHSFSCYNHDTKEIDFSDFVKLEVLRISVSRNLKKISMKIFGRIRNLFIMTKSRKCVLVELSITEPSRLKVLELEKVELHGLSEEVSKNLGELSLFGSTIKTMGVNPTDENNISKERFPILEKLTLFDFKPTRTRRRMNITLSPLKSLSLIYTQNIDINLFKSNKLEFFLLISMCINISSRLNEGIMRSIESQNLEIVVLYVRPVHNSNCIGPFHFKNLKVLKFLTVSAPMETVVSVTNCERLSAVLFGHAIQKISGERGRYGRRVVGSHPWVIKNCQNIGMLSLDNMNEFPLMDTTKIKGLTLANCGKDTLEKYNYVIDGEHFKKSLDCIDIVFDGENEHSLNINEIRVNLKKLVVEWKGGQESVEGLQALHNGCVAQIDSGVVWNKDLGSSSRFETSEKEKEESVDPYHVRNLIIRKFQDYVKSGL